jgi:hypothetical protein
LWGIDCLISALWSFLFFFSFFFFFPFFFKYKHISKIYLFCLGFYRRPLFKGGRYPVLPDFIKKSALASTSTLTPSHTCVVWAGDWLIRMADDNPIVLSDQDAMGEKAQMSHDEVVRLAQLSPEDQELEKKLRLRIDLLVMPLVILVYLMNYIDR